MICRTVSWFVIPARKEDKSLSLMSPNNALKVHLQWPRCHLVVLWCLCARGGVEKRIWDIQTNFLPPDPTHTLQPLNIPLSHP